MRAHQYDTDVYSMTHVSSHPAAAHLAGSHRSLCCSSPVLLQLHKAS